MKKLVTLVTAAVSVGVLIVATPASAEYPIKLFPSSEKLVHVPEGATAVIHGPGQKAKRKVVTFTVFVDGHARRLGVLEGKPESCWGAIDNYGVFVTVNACGRVAKVMATSVKRQHTVVAVWEWRPA